MSIDIKQEDVVKLILQYCKENGLQETFTTLQNETQITLNTIDDVQLFVSDIQQGRWDKVLQQITTLKIASHKLMDLFEQIIIELLEISENNTAQLILKDAIQVNQLKEQFPERCMKLEFLCRKPHFDYKEAYSDNVSKEKRRKNLAEKLREEIKQAPPSRLLALLGQSLKYQEIKGIVKPNIKLDIFTGDIPVEEDEQEKFPVYIDKNMKFSENNRIEALKFSYNGSFLVCGTVDGLIEVWDTMSGRIKTDLAYQAEDSFMIHTTSVLSLVLSRDNELLGSADKEGTVKIWRISTGKCLKKFEQSHAGKPVTCLAFGKDISHLLAASIEIKVLGLKSGKMIKEFRGHTNYITCIVLQDDGSRIVSGAIDGMIKFWNYATTECMMNFKPASDQPNCDLDIYNIIPINKDNSSFLICNKSNTIQLVNSSGNVLKTFQNEKKDVNFCCMCVSQKRNWVYALGTDNVLCCFNIKTGKIDHSLKVITDQQEVIGMVSHPLKNLLIVYTMQGNVIYLVP